jgi:hypothetical protein
MKAMIAAERLLRITGLSLMTIAAAVFVTMWITQVHAQGFAAQQQLEQARTNERSAVQVTEIDRRLDRLESKQAEQDVRIAGEDSRITAVYAFGTGVSTIMIILQLFQMLAPQKSKGISS